MRQIDFQANQLSQLYLQEVEVCVCMKEMESERRKCVCLTVERICVWVCVF